MKLLLITGLSGAGKSVALKALEDAGLETIDNLPLNFLKTVVGAGEKGRGLAIGTDIRSRDFSVDRFADTIQSLHKDKNIKLSVIYLDSEDDVLQQRFTETRRRHPLASERPVMDGIRQEREMLEPVRALADLVIDTSEMSPQHLRSVITSQYAADSKLQLAVTSFSYKRGLPREADLVFDVRFLKNPHYVPELKDKTGQDAAVGEYIQEDPGYAPFMKNLRNMLWPLLPRYREEGKYYLTVAIGCTGGQHRSVHVAEQLSAMLRDEGHQVVTRHRELQGG